MQKLQLVEDLPKKSRSNRQLKTIALVGQPNSGKSTLFNVLSDIKVVTSNFAGTTVEYKETLFNLYGETVHLIDLPGLYSLNAIEPAEYVSLNFLLKNRVDLIINVIDSTLLTRSLELTLELLELGLPVVVALNMTDEIRQHGIEIDAQRLSETLNVPVVQISALYGKGINELLDLCSNILSGQPSNINPQTICFSNPVEQIISKIEQSIGQKIPNPNIAKRFYAIKLLENPTLVENDVPFADGDVINFAKKKLEIDDEGAFFEIIERERHHKSMDLSHRVIKYIGRGKIPFAEKLDLLFLKPVSGYFFAILFFVLYFFLVFYFGNLLASIFEEPLGNLSELYSGLQQDNPLLWVTVDGLFQGIVGAVGIVLPYFIPLLLLTSILEESGYMARIAFLLDAIFHKIGLHGKSIASFVMGFGCTVPAVFATRIIESRRDRLIASILINFIPCSARLTVIFALTTALTGPFWTSVIFAYVLFAIAITGKVISLFMPEPTGLIMEIPKLRAPSFNIVARKTYYKLKDFFRVAFPFLVLGSMLLSLLDYFGFSRAINSLFAPIISGIIGLPEQLGSTLIFGFLRKELAVVMLSQAFDVSNLSLLPLTVGQAVVYLIFIVFYMPCVSTTAVFWKEFGWRHLLLTIAVGLVLSLASALIFRFALSLLGIF